MKHLLACLMLLCITLFKCNAEGCIAGDCLNGQGTIIKVNGDKYIGQYKNGVKSGKEPFAKTAGVKDILREKIYKACLTVESKNARADGQTDPRLAADYLCTIVANDCAARPDGKQCRKAKQRYGLNNK